MNILQGLLLAVAGKFVADEAKEILGWLPKRLIKWSAARFKEDVRERYEEEWLAHAQDLPGSITKLFHGLGCVWAAVSINGSPSRFALRLILTPAMELAAPLAILIFILSEKFGIIPKFAFGLVDLDQLRSTRLRFEAGGLTTLGLTQLRIDENDLRKLQRRISIAKEILRMHRELPLLQILDEGFARCIKRYSFAFRLAGVDHVELHSRFTSSITEKQ